MATETHRICIGDTLTPLGAQLKQRDANGALSAVNLTGLTVKFSMANSAGTVVVNEATTGVTVTDAANGKVQYDFQTADVATAGTFYGWFTVYSGAERDSYPTGNKKLIIIIDNPGT
jgi:hypothetical protein